MVNTRRRCTFCSCHDSAEYVLVGGRHAIPLCPHHAALVGEADGERVRPIDDSEHRPAMIDPDRLFAAAGSARF